MQSQGEAIRRANFRHPSIKMKTGRSVEHLRARATTKERVDDFYRRLGTQITKKGVPPGLIFNVDETGVAEGETQARRVIGTSLTRYSYVQESDSRTWVLILESVSAAGRRLTPVVIFTGKTLQGQWFNKDNIPDWHYDCTETGWSNARIFKSWFIDVFLPETDPGNGRWRILILDGHSPHITIPFMFLAWLNKVQLIYLPPHSLYLTQPLDVGIFSPLKIYFHQETAKFADLEARSPIQKQHFIQAYKIASDKAFTSKNIRAGFHCAGIIPCNVNRVLPELVEADRPISEFPPPKTPPQENQLSDDLWQTPRNAREVSSLLKRGRSDQNRDNRSSRMVERKVLKMTNQFISQNLLLRKEIERLRLKLSS
ncbi:hypothetical protein LCI18_010783 [Fusarium solani-melongenae]|uniref:Uncharacterized protein n=1 Tax=Fusarium solani subsp. cucurbitae TaxID=2747967 RepID=A0ACD3ZEV8_FUSSC|nr:hypothetical protein LCI18_010783 [Fusarium solani-melongenae]